jgi:quercetin dioxygenase-like cupin family protein
MKQVVRRALLSVGLAGVVMAVVVMGVTVAPSWATPPVGLTNVLLARGTNTSHGTIPLKFGTDVVMVRITVDPGGSSGWHSHPGGAIIIVEQGTLTVYSPVGHRCRTTTYSAGQAFIERPGEVDDVFNTSTIPYVLYVTFPRVPPGGATRIDEPAPGTCQVP